MGRIKNRYFVVELVTGGDPLLPLDINSSQLEAAVRQALLQVHGQFGSALADICLRVKYCNEVTRVGIVRGHHSHQQLISTALTLVTSVHSRPISLRTLYKGGTLMNCYKFLKRHQESRLEELWSRIPEEQRGTFRQAMMCVSLSNTQEGRAIYSRSVSQTR